MREHVIVADLGYGDAGKGTVVDWLCSRGSREPVRAVVRFNGGGQAAHNVVLPDGRHHTFAQFGAGTFHGVPTHLSRFMIVDPLSLAGEAAHLAGLGVPDPFELLTVDRDALLATPYHVAAGRAREVARGEDRHGSCGMGIGETMAYALEHPGLAPVAGDCATPAVLTRKLRALREALGAAAGPPVEDCVAAYRAFAERVRLVGSSFTAALLRRGPVVFEGAQGVLLDEWHGFHPHTTWSTTTFANALELLDGAAAVRLGVLRTYTPRHGPGPLVTEDAGLALPEPHNGTGPWQGPFRTGHFDAVAHRYALAAAGGADGLALTHLDAPVSRMCVSYDIGELPVGPAGDLDRQTRLTARLSDACPRYTDGITDWPQAVAEALGVRVWLGSSGPTAADKTVLDGEIASERV
ncbi:adenylosuccinate synthase [Streptosporangium becharense]|uniref:Adenylosuccinate synthetase n=1 Tax=Streptosporangium becharense TaxID=1816182 RepID=A0A7W9MHU0_9ACTN|nr:adenylosuccinate synthetase [Streptosporangium becharense]MBB2912372.1 adenylosuccinate synthase [Streptosporangium becharense]MBB5820799.1 adenylosuccinate synthase [Streptosporangium becharense]